MLSILAQIKHWCGIGVCIVVLYLTDIHTKKPIPKMKYRSIYLLLVLFRKYCKPFVITIKHCPLDGHLGTILLMNTLVPRRYCLSKCEPQLSLVPRRTLKLNGAKVKQLQATNTIPSPSETSNTNHRD